VWCFGRPSKCSALALPLVAETALLLLLLLLLLPAASLVPPEFSLSQLQAAARRDHRWLAMSSEALEGRLLALQQALGVS
jgi:hypothetical protein